MKPDRLECLVEVIIHSTFGFGAGKVTPSMKINRQPNSLSLTRNEKVLKDEQHTFSLDGDVRGGLIPDWPS